MSVLERTKTAGLRIRICIFWNLDPDLHFLGIWIRIRIRVNSWIWIRIKIDIQELKRLQKGVVEGLGRSMCRLKLEP
jgi:hypothetical protein